MWHLSEQMYFYRTKGIVIAGVRIGFSTKRVILYANWSRKGHKRCDKSYFLASIHKGIVWSCNLIKNTNMSDEASCLGLAGLIRSPFERYCMLGQLYVTKGGIYLMCYISRRC
jgi:hypothetical protein